MDLNKKIQARRKELEDEAALARESAQIKKQAREDVLEKEAADRLRERGIDLDEDLDFEAELDEKVEKLTARQARKNIPVSEWIALAILSYFALSLATVSLIGGVVFGFVIWRGYKYTFNKQKKLIVKRMSNNETPLQK